MLNQLPLHLMRSMAFFLGVLPASVRNACAVALGRGVYALDSRHRRVAIDNLTRAFGTEKHENEIREIARRTCENICRIVFEVCWALRIEKRKLSRYFSVSGLDHYRQAMAKGKGAILFTGHFGNWELMPIIGHMAGMPVRLAYRPLDLGFVDQFIKESRSRFGAIMIPSRRTGAMGRMYAALRRGHPVGMLVDQNEGWRKGVFAAFFGHPACSNPGIAILALKSGAPVIPVFMIRRGEGFHAEFGSPLAVTRSGDMTKDVESLVQQCNDVVEAYVRRYPEQWFWVHQRWKTPALCVWPDPARRTLWEAGQKRRGLL